MWELVYRGEYSCIKLNLPGLTAAAHESKPHLLFFLSATSQSPIGSGPGAAAPKEKKMVAVLLTTGVLIGILIAVAIIMIYTAIETRREEEARERIELNSRKKRLRQKMSEPRKRRDE